MGRIRRHPLRTISSIQALECFSNVTVDHVLEDFYDVLVRHGHNEHLTQIAARGTGNDLGLLMLEKPINANAKLRE